jgi:hypothetical protein
MPKPAGANIAQQQRHHLIYDLSQKEYQHLIMLTATPTVARLNNSAHCWDF